MDALTTISHILREIIYFLQITPDIACANYQDCTIIKEIQYLFQDDKDLETIQLGLLELPFVDIDNTELHYTLFHTENLNKFRIYGPTKESIIIVMAQGNLQAAQINFSPYIGYNRQIQQPLPQHRPQQQQQQQAPRAPRQGRQQNNDPLLVGILQTLTTNAQNHDRLAAEQKLESNKYLMFPKTVFSGDTIIEACQHWTNFKK